MTDTSPPKFPPCLEAATLTTADNLTTIAAAEGIVLGGERGEALPHLIAILYFIREGCTQAPALHGPHLHPPTAHGIFRVGGVGAG